MSLMGAMKNRLVMLAVFGCVATLFTPSAAATIGSSPVQTAATGSGKTATFSSNTVAGNAIIVFVGTDASSRVTNVTDDNSNSYTEIVENTTATRRCAIWFAVNITGGATTAVTMTTAASNPNSHIVIAEWNTTSNDFEIDQSNTADSVTQTNHPKGDITTAHDDTLVIGIHRNNTAFTTTSREAGYAVVDTTTRTEAIYQVYSSTVTTDGDITTASARNGGNAIASLNEIAGGADDDLMVIQ